MSRAAIFEVKNAFLSSDFGMEFALSHFSQEQIEQLPRYKKGPKAGKIRGQVSWVRVKEGGFVYSSPMFPLIPERYIENRPGKIIAIALMSAEWGESASIIASIYHKSDFQKNQDAKNGQYEIEAKARESAEKAAYLAEVARLDAQEAKLDARDAQRLNA
jgi:hypothetical protein